MKTTPSNAKKRSLKKIIIYKYLLGIALAVTLLDQASKYVITQLVAFNTYHNLPGIPVIEGFFYIVHIGNPGSAWGLLKDYPDLLILIAFIALAGIFYFRKQLQLENPRLQYVFGSLCGGIIGNLIDRLRLGYVIDFLDFHLPGYRWPAFNIADASICIGVFLYLFIASTIPSSQES